MLRGRQEAGIDLVSPSDLRAIYEASAGAGKPLPVSFVVGAHPIDHLAAMMRLPVDELGLVASLRDAPLPVVKCVTNDIRVPADAEWVLEGYLDARGHVEPEGPYGEFLGYYGALKRNPVFHLTAITRRRDALFQTSTIGGYSLARTDTALLNALRTEVMIWRALETAVREPHCRSRHGVERRHVQPPGGAAPTRSRRGAQRDRRLLRRAGQRQERVRGRSRHRHLLRRADGLGAGTRFQPDRDLMVVEGMRTLPLDPSLASGSGRRQGRLRPDLAVRQRRPARDPRAGAAALCRRAVRVGRGGACPRPEILRGADGRGGQPRWARGRARHRRAARKKASIATARAAISSTQNSAVAAHEGEQDP